MKQTPFSSLRWLKATHQRLSRRIQWHQWLLFLLRAGCIVMLVLALAKPLIGFWGSASVDRFVILDTSRSMGCQVEDKPALERAADLASRYVQSARVGDRTAVIFAASSPRLIAPPATDASAAQPAIQTVKPTQTDGNLSVTLPVIRSLLPRSKEREVELVFLTDNLKDRWQGPDVQAFLQELPNPVQVKVIETGSSGTPNAWIASARLLQFGPDEDRWIRVEVGCNSDTIATRTVRLTGIADLTDETQAVSPKPGQIARVDFRIAKDVNLQGQVAELRLEPADALPSDDVYYLNLDTSLATRVLVVEPAAPGADGRSVGLFLQTAMAALTNSKNQALDVATKPVAAVTASDVDKAEVIVLAGVPELADGVLEGLETRVRAGAGLALFLGPQMKPAFVKDKLYRPQQPTEGLLPLSLQGSLVDGKPGVLSNIRWTHPLLATLRDPVLQDFTLSRFPRYAGLVGAVSKQDAVLARFDDETPAIVEHPLGAGRVLIFNMSANDEWGDLPRRNSFLPLLDKTLTHLSAGGVKRNFIAGSSVTLPVPEGMSKGELRVTTPSGKKVKPRLLTQRGRTFFHLDEVGEVGAYRVETADAKTIVFTVNASRTDSPLSPMDKQALEEWWSPVPVEVLGMEDAAAQLAEQSRHWPLWPMLVLVAGVLLVAETVYVHVLCPRANPKAADSVVPKRGMMKRVD
jgi:hypothetical protein